MSKPPDTRPAPHRRLRVVWPLLLIMLLMILASAASVLVVSWARACANAITVYAVAEHRGVHALQRYAETGGDSHLQNFRASMAVARELEVARRQLLNPHMDYRRVHGALVSAGIPASDVAGIVRAFRGFSDYSLVARATRVWGEATALMLQLQPVGEQLHAEVSISGASTLTSRQLALRAEAIHARIAPLIGELGDMTNTAAHQIVRLMLLVLPLCGAALVGLAMMIYRSVDRRAEGATTALREATARLEFQATHDALTGLVNRPQFEALLTRAIARQAGSGEDGALMYFDLDQFKLVNDTCGHAAGDELLRQLASRLRRLVGGAGTLGRLGGDEFGLLLPDCPAAEAQRQAQCIRRAIAEQRFYWQDKTFTVSASIGVLSLGRHVPTVAEALSAADHACYLAKENGRDRAHYYLPDDTQVQQRCGEMHWVERLQVALDKDEFTLVAQEIRPVCFHPPRKLPGAAPHRRFELLLRLSSPHGDPVAPMAFIPAAERYGLMPRVDRWVIARACKELAWLRDRGLSLPTCMVNLSGASASDPELADYIASCLRANGLEGRSLGVELTETAAVRNIDACSELLTRLRRLGCPIALDDFGAGMSSFSYLRNLPVDFLKIDRSFVQRVAHDAIDHAMVETIQRIGGIMGVRTVAEGVESAEVLAALALIGVDFAQGYWVRRPVPLVQMQAVVGGVAGDAHRRAGPALVTNYVPAAASGAG